MMLRAWLHWSATLFFLVLSLPVSAHEVRPAYLEINDVGEQRYSVEFKQPLIDGRRLKLSPTFGPTCAPEGDALRQMRGNSVIEKWYVRCSTPLRQVAVKGLELTLTDVIVRISHGTEVHTALIRPNEPIFEIGSAPASAMYFGLGIEHILLGPDHLLFVAALVLLLQGSRIIWAATAFTVAHSFTLALAVLGHVSLPAGPVEIMIAASIVLIAIECVLFLRDQPTLISRYPWPIIFVIGLIHGLGFAGALADIGLPAGDEAFALLFFNLGIEAGQLAFIATFSGVLWLFRRFFDAQMMRVRLICAYAIGGTGAFWTLERIVA